MLLIQYVLLKDDVQKCDNTENPLNGQMQSTRNLKFGEQNDKDKGLVRIWCLDFIIIWL